MAQELGKVTGSVYSETDDPNYKSREDYFFNNLAMLTYEMVRHTPDVFESKQGEGVLAERFADEFIRLCGRLGKRWAAELETEYVRLMEKHRS
jgi:hypothetical protein